MTLPPPSSPADDPAPVKARKVGIKVWLYAALVALATGGVGYLVGAGREQLALKACESERTAEAAKHQEASAQRSEEATQLSERIQTLSARRTLHHAIMALEARNFGIAKDTLARAGKELESATKDEELKSAARRIASFPVDVTADIGAQRDALLDLTRSVDQRLDASNVAQ